MDEQTPSSRTWWTGILLLTLIGAGVRFADLSGQSIWYDEAYSARIAERSTTWELLTGAHRDNGNPPLYYIAHRWTTLLFGPGETSQRLFAAICGVLTIPVIGLLACRLFDRRAGWIAAALFAVSPLSVELSNEARVYSFLHLITALNALLLIRWLDTQKRRDGLAYVAVTALACFSHYFVVFFVMSHGLAVLAVAWGSKPGFGSLTWRLPQFSPLAPAAGERVRERGRAFQDASTWGHSSPSEEVNHGSVRVGESVVDRPPLPSPLPHGGEGTKPKSAHLANSNFEETDFIHPEARLSEQSPASVFWRWCVLMLGVAAVWAIWAPAFWDQIRTPGNLSRMAHAWIMQFASTPVVFSVGRTFAWRDAGPQLLGLAALISLAAFCVPVLIGAWRLWQRNFAHAVLLAGWVIFPVAIPFVVAVLKSPIYHHRYGSVGLSGFLCLAAIGISALPLTVRSMNLAIIGLATAFSLSNYYSQPIKDDWRSAARAVLKDAPADQVILTDSDIEVLPLMFYAARSGQIPHEVYGLMASAETSSRLTGVRYEDGRKLEDQPVDHTDRILSAPSICLALCVSERPLEEYRRLFAEHGYELIGEQDFYRITVVQFERKPGFEAVSQNR